MNISKTLVQDVYSHLLYSTLEIMEVIKSELDMESTVVLDYTDVDTAADVRKTFSFFGSGCGFAWIEYDKRNRIAKELMANREWRKGIEKYKRFLLKYEFTPEQKVFYRQSGAPLEATLSQNMVINTKILECVVAHFKTKYKISKMWVKSRID